MKKFSNRKENKEKVKEVEILQMIICGDKEVIAEVILKEDFEKYFERSDT